MLIETMDTTPERDEIITHSDEVKLFLEYGKKWGFFQILSGLKRQFQFRGAIYSLAFLVHEMTKNEGLASTKSTLESIDQAMTKLSNGGLNFFPLKQLVLKYQHQNIAEELEIGNKTGDIKLLNRIRLKERRIKEVHEMDMDGEHKIRQGSFQIINGELMPTWGLKILEKQLLPREIEEMLGRNGKSNSDLIPIKEELAETHEKVDNALKKST